MGDYEAEVDAAALKLSQVGITIGPIALPSEFKPAEFVQTVVDYKEQAVRQGWVCTRGIVISLDAKLTAAKAALARGDTIAAKEQLNALLNRVDAQAGKQLSPEAVALLQFNT